MEKFPPRWSQSLQWIISEARMEEISPEYGHFLQRGSSSVWSDGQTDEWADMGQYIGATSYIWVGPKLLFCPLNNQWMKFIKMMEKPTYDLLWNKTETLGISIMLMSMPQFVVPIKTLSWGACGMYTGWGGMGKFTHLFNSWSTGCFFMW